MPWCESCSKYWTPNAMNEDGTCPQCGEVVDAQHVHSDKAAEEKAPWHFKLMIVALVVYLGYRFWEMFFT